MKINEKNTKNGYYNSKSNLYPPTASLNETYGNKFSIVIKTTMKQHYT